MSCNTILSDSIANVRPSESSSQWQENTLAGQSRCLSRKALLACSRIPQQPPPSEILINKCVCIIYQLIQSVQEIGHLSAVLVCCSEIGNV